MTYNYQSLMCN